MAAAAFLSVPPGGAPPPCRLSRRRPVRRRRRPPLPPPTTSPLSAWRLATRRSATMAAAAAAAGGRGTSRRLALVTGATAGGIGATTATRLAEAGVDVLLTGRNEAGLQETASRMAAGSVAGILTADLSTVAGVGELARGVRAVVEARGGGGLHTLVNNAGVFLKRRTETADGLETTFAVNVVAPFLLTSLLLPCLEEAAVAAADAAADGGGGTPPPPPRVVQVSSISHMDTGGVVAWGDLQSTRGYSAYSSYGHSKLLLLMVAREMASRFAAAAPAPRSRVEALALDPGTVNTAMLLAGWGPCGIDVADAGDTAWAATAPDVASGAYYVGRTPRGGAPVSRDPVARARLWRLLAEVVASHGGGEVFPSL
ncbi:hypothetical protein I4F81_001537 [Pyropia yezoensis]|uniref:Uncharacterized protein n=1 Tax=Pyropia yezoensis TaxID=2788 RepID=A0ACC3BM03_PYRYE|nr:hypothetical protein I4F81_001537 [Neopyropia yezoensis]